MNYKDYQSARDAAWLTLIRFKVTEMPVRISAGIQQMGITLAPYSKAEALLKKLGLTCLLQETDGLSIYINSKYYISYREGYQKGGLKKLRPGVSRKMPGAEAKDLIGA